MAQERISILIVEDEPAIAELIAFAVKTVNWTPVQAFNGVEARNALKRFEPQVILLDWMLPDCSGLDLLREIRADSQRRHIPVIMLTARALESDKVAGLDNGADDYITKPFSPKELIARMNAVLRRRQPERAQSMLSLKGVVLDPVSCEVRVDGDLVEMGNAEYRLLKFLMANPNQVFSRAQLLDKVWRNQLDIEERTVDVHVLRLRKSLKDSGRLIRTVRGMGYSFSDRVLS